MTAFALGSGSSLSPLRHAISLNWSRVSAWSGSFSLHLLLALLLLLPPLAMKLREVARDDSIVVTMPSVLPPVVREPDLPVPPVRLKRTPPQVRPQITITAPIPSPLPAESAAPTNSIAPPADVAASAAPSDGGASDSAPSALAYGTQTQIPYPPIALRSRIEGKVILRVLVGEDGTVKEIEIDKTSGSRDLDRAAREAVMKWKFKPGLRAGVAYSGWALVPISFTLP